MPRLRIYSIIITSLAPNMGTTMTTISYLWISEPCPILLRLTTPLLLATRQCLLMIPTMMNLSHPSPQTRWTTLLLASIHKAQCQIGCDVHNAPTAILSYGRGNSTNTSSSISDLCNAKSVPATSGLLRKETWIAITSPSIISLGLISLCTSTTAQLPLALGASDERTDVSSDEIMQRDMSINNTLERMPLQYEEEYNRTDEGFGRGW